MTRSVTLHCYLAQKFGAETVNRPPPCIEGPTLISWAFFPKNSMMTRTYANYLLMFLLLTLGFSRHFCPKLPPFLSLFPVTLLTIQEAIFNEINDLRGGGL